MKKRILGMVLAVCMIIGCAPVMASEYIGTQYGDFLYYEIKYDNTIIITDCDEAATNVVIPSIINELLVTSIEARAFQDCSSLTSITIPHSVISIGMCAFANSGLTEVTIPDRVTQIGYSAFEGCTSLTNITIPDSVTCIYGNAFRGCTSLENITLSKNITYIGRDAFENTEYYNNKQNWDDEALYINSCLVATQLTPQSNIDNYIIKAGTTLIADATFEFCYNLSNVTLPDSLLYINSTFRYCADLNNIEIPSLVKSIDSNAFDFCNVNFIIDENNLYFTDVDGVLYNKDKTEIIKYRLDGRSEYSIPESVTRIADNAFYATSIKKINLPEGITYIGDSAFSDSGAENINIPGNVEYIGGGAFQRCRLSSVTIPDGINTINGETFAECSLKSVVIPNSVSSIKAGAFRYCSDLKDVYFNGTEAEWNNIKIETITNEFLRTATIHYNSVSPTSIPIITAEIVRTDAETDTAYSFDVNAADKYENCYVYAAVYDADGVLLRVSRVLLDTEGNTIISASKSESDALVKVFLWADTLQPIIEKAEKIPLI